MAPHRSPVLARLRQLAQFGLVGGICFVIDLAVLNLLLRVGPLENKPVIAAFVSASVATVLSWLGNRYWTFRATRHRTAAGSGAELVRFVLINCVGIAVQAAAVAVAHYLLFQTSTTATNVAYISGIVLAGIARFFGYRYLVFTGDGGQPPPPSPEAAPLADREGAAPG